jgi:hypothetical protein
MPVHRGRCVILFLFLRLTLRGRRVTPFLPFMREPADGIIHLLFIRMLTHRGRCVIHFLFPRLSHRGRRVLHLFTHRGWRDHLSLHAILNGLPLEVAISMPFGPGAIPQVRNFDNAFPATHAGNSPHRVCCCWRMRSTPLCVLLAVGSLVLFLCLLERVCCDA